MSATRFLPPERCGGDALSHTVACSLGGEEEQMTTFLEYLARFLAGGRYCQLSDNCRDNHGEFGTKVGRQPPCTGT
jgi:hypothetical protein